MPGCRFVDGVKQFSSSELYIVLRSLNSVQSSHYHYQTGLDNKSCFQQSLASSLESPSLDLLISTSTATSVRTGDGPLLRGPLCIVRKAIGALERFVGNTIESRLTLLVLVDAVFTRMMIRLKVIP